MEDLVKNFNNFKKTNDPKMFKFEVLICFWLSVHLEKVEYAQYLCLEDPLIEKILENLRKLGKDLLIENIAKRMQAKEKVDLTKAHTKKNSRKSIAGGLGPNEKIPTHFLEAAEEEWYNKQGVQNEGDLRDLKQLLSTPSAITFNTNVLRISLNMQEEKIASVIIARYKAKIDEEMVLRACKTGQLSFLYTMFAFNQNY